MIKSSLIINKAHRVAKPGEPHVPQAVFRKGEFPVDAYPDWAVAHMVKKGLAEVVEAKGDKEPSADEDAAKAKAEAEAAAAAKGKGK